MACERGRVRIQEQLAGHYMLTVYEDGPDGACRCAALCLTEKELRQVGATIDEMFNPRDNFTLDFSEPRKDDHKCKRPSR